MVTQQWETTPVLDSNDTTISRVANRLTDELLYVVTMYGDVQPRRLAELQQHLPDNAWLNSVESQARVTSFEFVVPQ